MATGAAWLNGNRLTERKKKRKRAKVCLDINRPSHGRSYPSGSCDLLATAPVASSLYRGQEKLMTRETEAQNGNSGLLLRYYTPALGAYNLSACPMEVSNETHCPVCTRRNGAYDQRVGAGTGRRHRQSPVRPPGESARR